MSDSMRKKLLSEAHDDDQRFHRRHEEVRELDVPVSALWVLLTVSFLDFLSGTITFPIIPFYAKSLGATDAQVG